MLGTLLKACARWYVISNRNAEHSVQRSSAAVTVNSETQDSELLPTTYVSRFLCWRICMKRLSYVPTAAISLLLTSPACACTTCDSALAQAVREEVLGTDFWPHVGLTILPFAIVLAITAAIYYGFPARSREITDHTAKGEIA